MVPALPSDELPRGEGVHTQIRRARVGSGHVLLARLGDGRVVAFATSCPHQVTPLDDATISDGRLRCPRHGYVYDTESGENVLPARDNRPEDLWKLRPGYLRCYDVEERDGWVWVAEEPRPAPASFDPSLEQRPVEVTSIHEPPLEAAPPAAVERTVRFLTVSSGTSFDVRLPTIPRQGFAWRVDVVGDVLDVVDEEFEPGGDLPCHHLRVAARGAGAGTLSCAYADGEGRPADVRTYVVRVEAPGV